MLQVTKISGFHFSPSVFETLVNSFNYQTDIQYGFLFLISS